VQGLAALLGDHTVRTVLLGSSIVGFVSGALGSFAYLRRQSLMGDVVSHAALLGIAAAFIVASLVTGSGHHTLALLLGATVAGVLSILFANLVVGHSRITMDGAMAVSLALFFGGGLTLMRVIQTGPFAQRAGLSSYIFGRAAAITSADLRLIAVFAFIALAFLLANWKVFELYSFDAVLAELVGFRGRLVEPLLQATIVLAVVIGLKLVGLILMIAFVVAPASAARQWTRSLSGMVLLAGCFGALASVLGTLLSVLAGDLPTGPVIVLVLTAIVAVSLVLAPRRGLVARAVRRRRERRELASEVRQVEA
jgi:manganese/zinc/iron transport system permease protein